jgi:hypothetical protein
MEHFEFRHRSTASLERLFDVPAAGATWSSWTEPLVRWSGRALLERQ